MCLENYNISDISYKNIIIIVVFVAAICGLGFKYYDTKCEKSKTDPTEEGFYSDGNKRTYDNVSCDRQAPPQGFDPDNNSVFKRIDAYGMLMPGRLNFGRAGCISGAQNQIICDNNMYENWYWFDTMKVGYPSRDLFAYESPSPVLSVRPKPELYNVFGKGTEMS